MAASDGYRFVPLPAEIHRERRPHARHDRRVDGTVRLVFELTYEVLAPIHIGAGYWTFRGRTPVRMAVRSGDRLVIPGSSMKGLLRARYEAITKSCCLGRAPKDRQLSHKLPSQTFLGYEVSFAASVRQHPVFDSCPVDGRLCAACALFGVMSLRGRVAVHDLIGPAAAAPVTKLPIRFSPRPHHLGRFEVDDRQRRLIVGELHGRKFYRGSLARPDGDGESAEVLPVGSQVQGAIACTNVTPAEVGGLLRALGFVPASVLRIGSAKAYPFGVLSPVRIGVVGELPDEFIADAAAAFERSRDRHAAGEDRLAAISEGRT